MKNPCEKCPMYWSSCDYWGECDEGCMRGINAWFSGKNLKFICYLPAFVKKLYVKYLNWKDKRYWEKHIMDYEYDEDGDLVDKIT